MSSSEGRLPPRIYILCGPVRSGKTTRLMEWVRARPNVEGVLTPVSDGLRRMIHLRTGESFPFEVGCLPCAKPIVSVGKYRFYEEAFARARSILLAAVEARSGWLIIDEVGKLELAGAGLEPALGRVIESYRQPENDGKLILVIRDSLLEESLARYRLSGICGIVEDPREVGGLEQRP